jgi:predicted dehydrogenase
VQRDDARRRRVVVEVDPFRYVRRVMVRVALLGAGRWGPNLLRTLAAHAASRVTWVVEPRAERLAAAAASCPDARTASDADAVFSAGDVDAVVLATPTSTHAALARRALEAGKHVLVEKPVATRLTEAEALAALAARAGRVLMVGHVYLFHPAVEAVQRVLASGQLGAVKALHFERTNPGPVRTDVDAAWDLAAHDVSIADAWLGALPSTVSATGAYALSRARADAVAAALRWADGTTAHLHVGWLEPTKTRRATVVGERALLRFEETVAGAAVTLFELVAGGADVRTGEARPVPVEPGEPLAREVAHFLDCVQTGGTPRCDGARAARVVRVLEAMSRSMARGGAEEAV